MAGIAARHRRRVTSQPLIVFKLAFRNIFRNRFRTALTLAAIVCGVAAIVVSGGFVEDIFVQLREATIHSRLGHLQVYRSGYLEYGTRDPARYRIDEPQRLVTMLRAEPHVQTVMTRLLLSGLANNGRADLPVVAEGIEPDSEARLGTATTVIAGRPLRDGDKYGAVVGEGVASALDLDAGSPITLTVSTPGGALNAQEFTVVGVFRTFSKDYDARAARISQVAAQELLGTKAVHSVVVVLDDTANTALVEAAVAPRLEALGYEVRPWYELADFYNKTVALYRRQFGALQLVILVLLLLGVASTINMVVYERTGEFGTLLALGCRPRRIFGLVMLENALLGVIGAAVGVATGVALAVALTHIGITMPPPPGSSAPYTATIRLVPWMLGAAVLIGALAAIAAAVLPGRRAARLSVVEALRHNV
jgi:putative ABC transport system permease protein